MKANKLIDFIKKHKHIKPLFNESVADKRITEINNAIKFDFGHYDDIHSDRICVEYQNLPYKTMYAEIRSDKNTVVGVLAVDDGNEIKAHINSFINEYAVVDGNGFLLKKDGTSFFFEDDFYTTKKTKALAGSDIHVISSFAHVFMQFIKILNCSNVELVDNIPSKLKQSRVKKGKMPLFEYKTVHIKQNTKRNMNKGEGKHASPRVHLRRGHIRTLQSGKTTWVQSCVVGSKESGVIHKDYMLHLE